MSSSALSVRARMSRMPWLIPLNNKKYLHSNILLKETKKFLETQSAKGRTWITSSIRDSAHAPNKFWIKCANQCSLHISGNSSLCQMQWVWSGSHQGGTLEYSLPFSLTRSSSQCNQAGDPSITLIITWNTSIRRSWCHPRPCLAVSSTHHLGHN